MRLLKGVLCVLQVLSTLFGISVFTFDSRRRRFKKNVVLRQWMNLLHVLVIPFLCILLGVYGVLLARQLMVAVQDGLQGTAGLHASYLTMLLAGPIVKCMLLVHIAYIYRKRVRQLEELLNGFVSVCDQHAILFGPKLRIHWFAGAAMLCRIFSFDIYIWTMTILDTNYTNLFLMFIIMVAPGIGICASLVALLLLHALFRDATLSTKHTFWCKRLDRRRTLRLLRFYHDLLRLYDNLEQYLKPFIVVQLLVEAISILFFFQFIRLIGLRFIGPLIAMLLIYPYLHAHLCHNMSIALQKMGHELLAFDSEHMTVEASKLVELFCLQKSLVDRLRNRYWHALHLRREFILEYLNICYVNGMFLITIVFTSPLLRFRNPNWDTNIPD